ncbi:MFS transporter [Demetria terragena]|uniref:MFS transporter n=1 Tax=Demetria terragena TaxID=63959 RepID=UPI00036CECB6|nr:MFS transporter [Demetria terragena]
MSPFRWFWAGEAVSGLGSWISFVILQVIVVTTLQAGSVGTGLLSAARWLPYLLFGLLIGALVDRYARRPVMIGSDLARAGLTVLIPLAWWLDALSLPLVLALVALTALVTLVNDAASLSFLPRLVSREHLQPAHSRLDGTSAVSEVAGPSLAGLIVTVVAAPIALIATAASALFSAAAVAMIRVPEPAPPPAQDRNLRAEIAAGLRWVYRGGVLFHLAIWTHVWFAGQATLGAVLAVYLLESLGLSPLTFALVTAGAGVGALLGALTSPALGRRFGSGRTVIGVHLLSAGGVAAMVCAQAFPPAGTLALLGLGQTMHGFAMGASNSHEMAYRQLLTPDELQARTNTTMRSMNRAVVVVVAPVVGVLATQTGVSAMLVVAAGLFAAAAIGLWHSPFREARLGAFTETT